jgi:beta-galactosidase
VELFHNGQSLGAKNMKKDSHLAWNVKYAPGTIEARGYKGDKVVMTAKRETTGPAATLVMAADRKELAADGEDVAMFAVQVKDAHDRVVPITDNEVTFKISGEGKLIGVGNGDPTDLASDKGSSRKAFSGCCMAVIQSTRKGGSITVEAISPGLAPSTVTISTKPVTLRPQVDVWERDVPTGSGITGLWRPEPLPGASQVLAFLAGGDSVYSLKQDGSTLSGSVEGAGVSFIGGMDVPSPVVDGKVDGSSISFKAAGNSYTGTVKGDRIELQRSINLGWEMPKPPEKPADAPAIGPAPDGSDPSIDASWKIPSSIPLVLRKVQR